MKKYKGIILFLLISLISVLPLLVDGLYSGHDTTFHINRIVGVADAFRDGQIIPRIYPYTNNGYGYIVPLVLYCDLFVYPFAILYILGLPLVITYKSMVIFYVILGNYLTYKLSYKLFNNKKLSLLILFFYAFIPYRFINIFIRGALGEVFSNAFLPIVFYSLYNIFVLNKRNYILLGLGMALIAMNHNLTLLLVSLIIAIFYLYFIITNLSNKSYLKDITVQLIKATIIAILLSIWYLGPMIEMLMSHNLVVNVASNVFDLSLNTINLSALFNLNAFSNYQLMGPIEIGTYGLGFVSILILIYTVIFRNKNKLINILIILITILLLIMSGIIPIYNYIDLSILQFSFRWNIVIIPSIVIVCAYSLNSLKNKYLVIILGMFFVFGYGNNIINYFNNDLTIHNTDSAYHILEENISLIKDHNEVQMSDAMFLPLTEKNDYLEDTTFIKLVEKGLYVDHIYEYERYFSKIEFTYNSKGNELLMLPLTYYKGYEINAVNEDEQIKLKPVDIETYHKVGFYTLDGNYTYITKYKGTIIQVLTLISSVSMLIILLWHKMK